MSRKFRTFAKVARPILTNCYPRKRGFKLLEECMKLPVTWISGPAGCGKTTLVNSYLEEYNLNPLWYLVDEGDADPATFFYYMGEAAEALAPQKKKSLPLLTPEYQSSLTHFAIRYFDQLFYLMPDKTVIVLDNYQEAASSAFSLLIRQALSRLPKRIQVIIISRTVPPPELARLELNRQMSTISWNELRLSPDETAGIVALLYPGILPDNKIQDVHRISDGWAAGVVLMAQKAVSEGIDPMMFLRQNPEVIFDYFASEVLGGMDDSTREFLLKTAFLPKMSENMARELTGNADADRILRLLSKKNCFVEKRFQKDAVYSYHPLFRQFLLKQSKSEFSPDEIRDLSFRAARMLEGEGFVDESLALILEAEDWDALSTYLSDHVDSLLEQGRHKCLERILSAVPDEILTRYPYMLLCFGRCRIPFDPMESIGLLEKAYSRFKDDDDLLGVFNAWTGMANVVAYGFLDTARANELIRDMEERMDYFNSLCSDKVRALVSSGMFLLMALRRPEYPTIDFWAGKALELNRKIGNAEGIISVMIARVWHRLATGSMRQVKKEIDDIHRYASEHAFSEMVQLEIKLCEALSYDLSLMHNQCLEAVESGLELANVSGIHILDTPLMCHASMSCMNVGDLDRASHYIEMLSRYDVDSRAWIQMLVHWSKSRYAVIRGDLVEAESQAELAYDLNQKTVTPLWSGFYLIYHALLVNRLGRTDLSMELLNMVIPIVLHLKSPLLQICLEFLQAGIAYDRGDDEQGLAYLKDVLPDAEEGDFWVAWDIPGYTADICLRLLNSGIETAYIHELIRKRRLIPDIPPVSSESWPWPVKIYTMGCFRILVEDVPLKFSKKIQRKPLEMLQTLIILGGKQVSDERIADILWPDSDGDMGFQSCITTLHRVRKMLGHHDAIIRQNNLLTINTSCVWVDAWAFEDLLSNADKMMEKASAVREVEETEKLIYKALDLYRGEFLPDEYRSPEAVSLREQLLDKYFTGLYLLTDRKMKNMDWEEAKRLFEKGLSRDESAESCYQGLMVCFQKLGKKPEAMAVFERCRKILEVKFGVTPSSDTVALAEKIRSSMNN